MSLKLTIFACLAATALATPPYRGFSVPLFNPRIVGGNEAEAGQFPWQVSLYWGLIGSSHFCGGTILNEKWILTAGHCVQGIPSYGTFDAKVGKHNLKLNEPNEQTISVEKSFVHEKYTGGVAPYDIALLKLSRPLKLNKAVAAISLPKAGSLPVGNLILSGWGSTSRTSNPIMPDTLQTVTLPVVSIPECKKAVESLTGPSPLHETNVCTGPLTGGFSACSGDSGGPLISTGSKPEIIGVVSWGIIPCGTRGAPSVYTRVSAFVDWIQDTMAKN